MATRYLPGERIPMSRAEYETLHHDDVRGEYVDGELVVNAFPSRRHQVIAGNVWLVLRTQLPSGLAAIQGWGWKAGDDEFGPDVMVFDETEDDKRLTATPHLVVEVLSSDPARDLVRRYAKFADAGVARYWVIDPDGPVIVEYHLSGDSATYLEVGRHTGDRPVTLDIAVGEVTLVPGDLLG